MQEKTIAFRQSGNILYLIINRPNALNALNRAVFLELERFFTRDYRDYGHLDGVVITGAGEKAFVAGADITELAELNPQTAEELVERGHRVFNAIESFYRPVVAIVNGYALGGGCELAMACHLRLATPNARFGLPELGLGLIPGYGGTQRLVACIGRGKALEFMLTSDMMDAETAGRLGLVNNVLPSEEMEEYVEKLIRKIATRGPKAVEYAIASVNAYSPGSKRGFEVEKKFFVDLTQSDEGKEGLRAFIEKRKPDFGRARK